MCQRNFFLRYGDLTAGNNLTRIVQEVQPEEVYNPVAQSQVAVSFESPEYNADVDALGTLLAQSCDPARIVTRTHTELDLREQGAVQAFFAQKRPNQIYLATAKVGGIHANITCPDDFPYDNLMLQANVIEAAHRYGMPKLLFLGSSCIYPGSLLSP